MSVARKPSDLRIDLTLLTPNRLFGGVANERPARKYNWTREKKRYEKISQTKPLFVIDGLLEGLADIRPAITWIRQQLHDGKKLTIVFGYTNGWWQWNELQMGLLMRSAGIALQNVRLRVDGTHEGQLECTRQEYDRFLQTHHLPAADVEHLIVTTEHSEYRVTGGIGSYVKEASSLYGPKTGILIVDSNKDLDIDKIQANGWFCAQTFLSRERIDQIDMSNFDTGGDIVLETLESLLCLYPKIQSIEAQEMLLYRTIEAKRLSLLAVSPKLITVCHGSSFHLSKANRDVLPAENIHVAYREKLSLEESDIVIFPTSFLRESYRDYGIERLDDRSRVIKRLPFDYKRIPDGKSLVRYKRLLYVGKTSTIKGFDLFLETIDQLNTTNPELMSSFDEILVVATSVDIVDPHLRNLFNHLADILPLRIVSLSREELLKTYSEYSADTLALVTYRGDNHSLAVLELMAVGLDFLAADAAGTPELIPNAFKEDYLVQPNTEAFVKALENAAANTSARSKLVASLRSAYRGEQEAINGQYSISYFQNIPILPQADSTSIKASAHIQIIDTGDEHALSQTVSSVENQTYENLSYEVSLLDAKLQKSGNATMRLFAGDILRADAIELMVSALMVPNRACILSYEEAPTYHGQELKGVEEFHPFPPQLGSVFLQEKYSRRFVGLFTNDVLFPTEFNDWQKAIYVKTKGKAVAVVPRLLVKLAVQDGYPGENKEQQTSHTVHSFSALPVFDAYILHSELQRFDDIYWGLKLRGHMPEHFVRRDDPTILHGNTPLLAKTVDIYKNRLPKIVKNSIRYSIRALYKIGRMVRRRPKKT